MFCSQVNLVNLEIPALMVHPASVVPLVGRETVALPGSLVRESSLSTLDRTPKAQEQTYLLFFSNGRPARVPWSTRLRRSSGSSWSPRVSVCSPRLPHHPAQPGPGRALLSRWNEPHLWRILAALRAGQWKGTRTGPRYDQDPLHWRSRKKPCDQPPLCFSFDHQAQLAAVCAGSAPCPSCSATSTTSATLPPATTTPTGCPRPSPCPCPWRPSLGRASSRSSAGEVFREVSGTAAIWKVTFPQVHLKLYCVKFLPPGRHIADGSTHSFTIPSMWTRVACAHQPGALIPQPQWSHPSAHPKKTRLD